MILYLWSKFQQNRALFGGERAEKPPKMGHFMDAAPPRNNLKFYNLGTTNAIKMKLTTIMHLHEALNLAQKLGRNPKGVRGR